MNYLKKLQQSDEFEYCEGATAEEIQIVERWNIIISCGRTHQTVERRTQRPRRFSRTQLRN